MENKTLLKICPSEEELSSVCSRVKCPEVDCNCFFKSTSNLNMHLIRHHKIMNDGLTRKTNAQYYCPAKSCSYFKDSSKYFTKLKYLKQHFLKVHAMKTFQCNKCSKKFSTRGYLSTHVKNCGKEFTCNCGFRYTSSEALLTHCKRKGEGHSLIVKNKTKTEKSQTYIKHFTEASGKKTERLIYPKLSCDMSFPIHYIAAVALSELSTPCNLSKSIDKGVQTDLNETGHSKTSKSVIDSCKVEKKRKSSQHTQTISKLKRLKISIQTQTNSVYLKSKPVKQNLKNLPRRRKKSMETQTKDVKVKDSLKNQGKDKVLGDLPASDTITKDTKITKNVNYMNKVEEKSEFDRDKERKWLWDHQFFESDKSSSTPVDDVIRNDIFGLNLHSKEPNLNECSCLSEKNNTSQFSGEQGTENQLFDLTKLCNIETQTEIDAFLTECDEDTTFTICSTETQTTDDFDSLLYSNMCTQTCDDVDELFDFNFVHIETQTTWPDF